MRRTSMPVAPANQFLKLDRMIIARTEAADRTVIRRVNELAFGQPNEAALVDGLRDTAQPQLSLVALKAGQIVSLINRRYRICRISRLAWRPRSAAFCGRESPHGRRASGPTSKELGSAEGPGHQTSQRG